MTYIGTIIAISGFVLFWFDLITGILTSVIGISLIWVNEDQKVKKRIQKEQINDTILDEFNILKYTEPLSPRTFELATLLYGTIEPHRAWLLKKIAEFEKIYKNDPNEVLEEIRKKEDGIFKNLFSSSDEYKNICDFLDIDLIDQISNLLKNNFENTEKNSEKFKISEILNDYDLEEWVNITIKSLHDKDFKPNEIMSFLKENISEDQKKNFNISFSDGIFVINEKITVNIN
tara:strand:+ start:118 stop:813 length:696 start_codon:yes stop_codon:yes gene_type:complete